MRVILVLEVLALALLLGCASTTTPDDRIARVSLIVGRAAEVSGALYLTKHPEARAKFEEVAERLRQLEAKKNYDSAAFVAALNELPLKELHGPNGSLYITAATIAYEDMAVFAQQQHLSDAKWIAPILTRLRSGLEHAIAVSASPK